MFFDEFFTKLVLYIAKILVRFRMRIQRTVTKSEGLPEDLDQSEA